MCPHINQKLEILLSEILNEECYDKSFDMWCSSAWSPPIEGLTNVSKDYPNLCFYIHYIEDGMGYAGEATIVAGNCNDVVLDYDKESDNYEDEE
jgi:hypothetical protein